MKEIRLPTAKISTWWWKTATRQVFQFWPAFGATLVSACCFGQFHCSYNCCWGLEGCCPSTRFCFFFVVISFSFSFIVFLCFLCSFFVCIFMISTWMIFVITFELITWVRNKTPEKQKQEKKPMRKKRKRKQKKMEATKKGKETSKGYPPEMDRKMPENAWRGEGGPREEEHPYLGRTHENLEHWF